MWRRSAESERRGGNRGRTAAAIAGLIAGLSALVLIDPKLSPFDGEDNPDPAEQSVPGRKGQEQDKSQALAKKLEGLIANGEWVTVLNGSVQIPAKKGDEVGWDTYSMVLAVGDPNLVGSAKQTINSDIYIFNVHHTNNIPDVVPIALSPDSIINTASPNQGSVVPDRFLNVRLAPAPDGSFQISEIATNSTFNAYNAYNAYPPVEVGAYSFTIPDQPPLLPTNHRPAA